MKWRTALVISVLAGVLLGTVSNWLYDLLRDYGFFPDRAGWKAVVIIGVSVLPLVFLVVLPEVMERRQEGRERQGRKSQDVGVAIRAEDLEAGRDAILVVGDLERVVRLPATR